MSNISTYTSKTLASLGVTPGVYTYTFGSGSTADSFIIYAGVPVPVDEPPSLALLPAAAGLTWLATRARRRAKRAAALR